MMLVALALPACAGDGGASFDGPLSYVRGGGQTGEARKLTVRPDGTGTFVVERGLAQPREVAIRLTAGERDRLAKAVASVDLGAIAEDESEPIPDAFGYGISSATRRSTGRPKIGPRAPRAVSRTVAVAEKYGPSDPARVTLVELSEHRLQLAHAARDLMVVAVVPAHVWPR